MACSIYTPSCIGRRMFAGISQTSVSLSHYPPPPPRRMFAGISQTSVSLSHYPPPPPREVHFWYLHPEEVQDTSLIDAYKGLLSSEEYAQILQLEGKQIQKQALLARVLVGIDVEEKTRRTSTNILAFAKRWFSSPEIAWLDAFTDPEEQRQKFIQLWTLKEAYVKALGKGISGSPLKDFSIHIKHHPVRNEHIEHYEDAGSDSVVSTIKLEVLEKSGPIKPNWQFLLFQPTNMHYASVCIGQDEKCLHVAEDEMSQMSSCSCLKVHAWKTVPLVKDVSLSVKETIIASTNARSF